MPHQASGSPVGVGRVHLPRLWPCAQVCPSLNRTRRPSIKSGQLNTPEGTSSVRRERTSRAQWHSRGDSPHVHVEWCPSIRLGRGLRGHRGFSEARPAGCDQPACSAREWNLCTSRARSWPGMFHFRLTRGRTPTLASGCSTTAENESRTPDGHPPLGAKRWGPGVSSDTLDDGTTEHIDGGDRRLVRREMPGIAVTPAALPPPAGWKLCTRPKRHGKGTIGSAVEARRQRVRRHLRRPHARGGEPLGNECQKHRSSYPQRGDSGKPSPSTTTRASMPTPTLWRPKPIRTAQHPSQWQPPSTRRPSPFRREGGHRACGGPGTGADLSAPPAPHLFPVQRPQLLSGCERLRAGAV